MLSRQTKRVFSGFTLAGILLAAVNLTRQSRWAFVLSGDPAKQKGALGAAVTLVEFSDFQCPSCRAAQPLLKNLMERYPGEIRLIFKHYPLQRHPYARLAAIASECAKEQQKFWPMHDLLFEKQQEWSHLPDAAAANARFSEYAKSLGLEMERFERCKSSPTAASAVEADIVEGDRRGVDSTPTFFLNEFTLSGTTQLYREGARLTEIAIRDAKRK